MVIKLSTTVTKINFVSNADNSRIIRDFYEYMKANGTSENYLKRSHFSDLIVVCVFYFQWLLLAIPIIVNQLL
jgi:hypothetical protein